MLDGGRTGSEVMHRTVKEVEGVGRILEVAEQFLKGNPRETLFAALQQPVVQALVPQPHGDDQLRGSAGERRQGRHGSPMQNGLRLRQIRLARGGIVEDAAVFVLKPETHNRHEVGMANALDQLQGAEFLASFSAAKTNDLQRRLGPAGALTFQTSPKPPRPRNSTSR